MQTTTKKNSKFEKEAKSYENPILHHRIAFFCLSLDVSYEHSEVFPTIFFYPCLFHLSLLVLFFIRFLLRVVLIFAGPKRCIFSREPNFLLCSIFRLVLIFACLKWFLFSRVPKTAKIRTREV